jgi:UDP-3-O-[3-hydroxymyristoyl] glucosamine N-acyltransferase
MITLQEIATHIEGELNGDGNLPIRTLASIRSAETGDITFLLNRSFEKDLASSKASAVIVGRDVDTALLAIKNIIIVKNPSLSYAKAAELFEPALPNPPQHGPGSFISESATVSGEAKVFPYCYIGDGAVIDRNVVLFPFSFIGNDVHIGEGSIVRPHVSIYDGTIIGKRVIIHSGAVLGSDGFRYEWDGRQQKKVAQLGMLIIEDDVEIGANTCIDRASLDQTIVKKGAKIDNLVQIAHNVSVGESTILVSQVGVAGSTTIGNYVVLGGKVGVADHISIGDQVMAAGGAGITKTVPAKSIVAGNPHMNHRDWLKSQIYIRKLPELFERIARLEKIISNGVQDDRDK